VMELRSRIEPVRVVGDPDDVHLSADAVRLADLPR